MKKKIAIFENEYHLVDTLFDVANYYYFNGDFTFEYFPSSQSLTPFENIKDYPLIIVDIDLSQKSELDGYGLIAKINRTVNNPNIIVLTGHSKVEETLEQKGFPKYPIMTKPLSIEEIHNKLTPFA